MKRKYQHESEERHDSTDQWNKSCSCQGSKQNFSTSKDRFLNENDAIPRVILFSNRWSEQGTTTRRKTHRGTLKLGQKYQWKTKQESQHLSLIYIQKIHEVFLSN